MTKKEQLMLLEERLKGTPLEEEIDYLKGKLLDKWRNSISTELINFESKEDFEGFKSYINELKEVDIEIISSSLSIREYLLISSNLTHFIYVFENMTLPDIKVIKSTIKYIWVSNRVLDSVKNQKIFYILNLYPDLNMDEVIFHKEFKDYINKMKKLIELNKEQ